MGSNCLIASIPNACSRAEIKVSKGNGLLLPILNIRWGAQLIEGFGEERSKSVCAIAGLRNTRTTPSTISLIYVKSLSILPWLKTRIGSAASIALANNIGDMSGRPQGP